MFVSTDGRRACRRGAIGSTMGAYPRDTGSNPVEGNGHFFPHTVSSIFRLSLTHTHTHARAPCSPAHHIYIHTHNLHMSASTITTCTCLHPPSQPAHIYTHTHNLHVSASTIATCTCLHPPSQPAYIYTHTHNPLGEMQRHVYIRIPVRALISLTGKGVKSMVIERRHPESVRSRAEI